MDKRQQKLISDYGQKFYERNRSIQDEFLYLSADAYSVLTDAEWVECAKAIEKTITELKRVNKIVCNRMKEVGLSVE